MTNSLWSRDAHARYLADRDSRTEQRAQWREAAHLAANPLALWEDLDQLERWVLQWMLLNATPSLVGRCDDDVLKRLMNRGVLHWPPGVRPVLTDDLVTTFHVGPALWSALEKSAGQWLPDQQQQEALLEKLNQQFAQRWVPLRDQGQAAAAALRDQTP